MIWTKNMQPIDFSIKHNIILVDEEGRKQHMDEPYFKAASIAPGVWKILSDGDFSYLVAGEKEALMIDSGYGCGSIRSFAQSLVEVPVWRVANTHDHFDHTGNNYLFDCAYMSQETYERRTIPYPSFRGLDFPRDYPVVVIEEGDSFDLGGRTLEVIALSDHAPGSLAFLDRTGRLLFSGDEIMPQQFVARYSIHHSIEDLKKLMAVRDAFDRVCTGPGVYDASIIEEYYEIFQYLLDGHIGIGEPAPEPKVVEAPPAQPLEKIVFERREARPCDMFRKRPIDPDLIHKRIWVCDGHRIVYYDNKI